MRDAVVGRGGIAMSYGEEGRTDDVSRIVDGDGDGGGDGETDGAGAGAGAGGVVVDEIIEAGDEDKTAANGKEG